LKPTSSDAVIFAWSTSAHVVGSAAGKDARASEKPLLKRERSLQMTKPKSKIRAKNEAI
jgi:hypothetical protein